MIMKVLNVKFMSIWVLLLIIILGFVLRIYKIESPIADWHSWRQADTAAVARNFYKEDYNPFIPKYDDMSSISEVNIPNHQRYRFVEFPIYSSLVYFAYLLNDGVDEKLARLVSIFFSLGSIVFIYLITKKYSDTMVALMASFIFAALPFSVFYSRTILPEPSLVFFSLGMLYFVDKWIWENKFWLYIVSLIFITCALLTKPIAGFFLLPLAYSFFKKEKKIFPIPLRYFGLFVPAMLPFVGWRLWMMQYPEGIPASNWLLNGNGIRFRPAFWRWIIQDRLGREILGVTGSCLFLLGLILKPLSSKGTFLHLLALSSFLYLIVFATGNVQHDYYQVMITPTIAIFTAIGFVSLIRGFNNFIPRFFSIPIAVFLMVICLMLTWYEVRGLYQINNPSIVEAGRFADKALPKNAIVVAPYGGDTAFLYQTNRPGWPVVAFSIDEMITKYGVSHYISVNYDDQTKALMEKYQVLEKNPNFVILDLKSRN